MKLFVIMKMNKEIRMMIIMGKLLLFSVVEISFFIVVLRISRIK